MTKGVFFSMIKQFSITSQMISQDILDQAIDPAVAKTLRFGLLNGEQPRIAEEVAINHELPPSELRGKIDYGRKKQQELTDQVREARTRHETTEVLSQLTELRRLFHVSTILARAELLTRADQASVSHYVGDEAKFDDLTILERGRGFLQIELEHESTAAQHPLLMDRLAAFEHAERRIEQTEY